MPDKKRTSPSGRLAAYRRTVSVSTGSVAASGRTDVTATLTGVATTDIISANPTTAIATGLGFGGAFCATANVVTFSFVNPTTAAIATSTPSFKCVVHKFTL